jgi:hypothetical protein
MAFRAPECECGHREGDHRGGMEAIRRGHCRECDCTRFVRVDPMLQVMRDAARRSVERAVRELRDEEAA